MAKDRQTVYRDKDTGRLVSKSEWEKSHGASGQYVRSTTEKREAIANEERLLREARSSAPRFTNREIGKMAEEAFERVSQEEPEIDLGEDEY